ncbi:uncharacterized protein N7469_009039 [Penicillium citrinum]|uniref:beta-glucosidase n=1 Tax=Penicillium citrinum TaxID=5077 RepID=A0A9W9THM5_PENCI|nr:uncharacterized protein N7469_009039 [Penicillium citrinum]KAJ5222799.1 hypothetical protein N7469_009039 [Penicillium citrinum]
MGSMRPNVDIDLLLRQLTREEKISLLSATDWWRTPAIQRDGFTIPHIKATDGPNGARGESYVSGIKAACFPCGTSMGASFDRELLFRTGQEIAREAKTKAANVLLAPTLNVIRSPRGGRNYETYSEDPFVLGVLGAAFINGCQSEGIAATPKHFVANETENNRKILTAEVDEQTLRELYLLPFQLVMKHSNPWCFMTSYNRVNGTYVADSDRLLNGILRGEWGFRNLVVSDWMGVYSTAQCLNAGVDLEMPGPTKWRGEKLMQAVENGEVSAETINASARRVLELARALGRFENPEEAPERCASDTDRDLFIRDASAAGMVVLKNDGDVLPLPKGSRVTVVGYHALHAALGGGGSARVDAIHAVSPAEGLKAAGYEVDARMPEPVKVEWFNGHTIGDNLALEERRKLPEYMIKEKWPTYLEQVYCTRMTYDVCPSSSGEHLLSVISTGPANCYIDGKCVFKREQETNLSPESFYFFKSQLERRFTAFMEAGRLYTLVLESWSADQEILHGKPLYGRMFQGSSLRFQEFVDEQQRINEACKSAERADYAVVCVGTTSEIESEGFDRNSMDLTCSQYEQIQALVASNARTIVVNFSGGPVNLSTIVDQVPALIQAWFPGQECGHSLARLLSGEVCPSGRLPFSWAHRDSDNPTIHNFPCDEDNVVRYEERLDVGYRYYDRPESPAPLFPFGFGLSYTQFEVTGLRATRVVFSLSDMTVEITCDAKNVGSRDGAAILQYYVQFPAGAGADGCNRPIKELKEFQKVYIPSGESREVQVTFDKYSISYFDVKRDSWAADIGEYKVQLAPRLEGPLVSAMAVSSRGRLGERALAKTLDLILQHVCQAMTVQNIPHT